jgi:hypothetical protein
MFGSGDERLATGAGDPCQAARRRGASSACGWHLVCSQQRVRGAGVVIGFAAIGGSGALVENDPTGLFATINAFAWLA